MDVFRHDDVAEDVKSVFLWCGFNGEFEAVSGCCCA
jgi:hypothetical protein